MWTFRPLSPKSFTKAQPLWALTGLDLLTLEGLKRLRWLGFLQKSLQALKPLGLIGLTAALPKATVAWLKTDQPEINPCLALAYVRPDETCTTRQQLQALLWQAQPPGLEAATELLVWTLQALSQEGVEALTAITDLQTQEGLALAGLLQGQGFRAVCQFYHYQLSPQWLKTPHLPWHSGAPYKTASLWGPIKAYQRSQLAQLWNLALPTEARTALAFEEPSALKPLFGFKQWLYQQGLNVLRPKAKVCLSLEQGLWQTPSLSEGLQAAYHLKSANYREFDLNIISPPHSPDLAAHTLSEAFAQAFKSTLAPQVNLTLWQHQHGALQALTQWQAPPPVITRQLWVKDGLTPISLGLHVKPGLALVETLLTSPTPAAPSWLNQ